MHAPASPLCASCLATLLSASGATLKCMTMTPMTRSLLSIIAGNLVIGCTICHVRTFLLAGWPNDVAAPGPPRPVPRRTVWPRVPAQGAVRRGAEAQPVHN